MLALAVAALVCSSSPLDDGIALYQSLEFEKATIALQKLVLDPELPEKTKAEAFLWLGLSYGQLGDTDGARTSFHRAMVADATLAAPPDTPPALLTMLEEERAAVVASAKSASAATTTTTTTTTATPPPAPVEKGPNLAAVGSGIGAGVLAIAAIGVGGFGAQQLSVAYDLDVPAKPAFAAYDTAVTCGVVASVLGGAAAVAGGVSAALFVLE